ncbi:hypothetical protein [Methanococcus maripaludis]|uniref:Uncharacterized protein n=1 Tax=Methanococcus maripaludis TaxID=39152 RepID=A0A8T4H135_METMI|nr:hypothetical protein [Methanococcus maripaludis]MBM7408795.1 hypothetical protein [Methanococcus maripaludis]MBP2219036.1 hypothetical protein [Methanococcus maripaludis]
MREKERNKKKGYQIIAGAILVVLACLMGIYYIFNHPGAFLNMVGIILFYGFVFLVICYAIQHIMKAKKKLDDKAEKIGASFQNKPKK